MPKRVIEGVEELKVLVGAEAGVSDWVEVTQPMINGFADITGDHQWIHVDVERAGKDSPFGGTIAHGFLTLSLLARLSQESIEHRGNFKMRINYGLNRLRFVSPVPAGSRVRARFAVRSVDVVPGGIQTVWQVTVEIDGATKPALVAEWLTRAYYA